MEETGIPDTPTPTAKEPTMRASEARIKANQLNAKRSTGPKTPDGKERSRRNGLKHGMTGRGIVIPEEEVNEVEQRHRALQAELAPQSAMGAILVGQMATLSVRMERGAKQEFAAVAIRVRHASDVFDAERIDTARQLFQGIGDDPRETRRRLLESPEGVEVLLEAWGDLRASLTRVSTPIWNMANQATMTQLLGLRDREDRADRIDALSRASWGNPVPPEELDGVPSEREACKVWARARLLEWVDAEIAGLEAHYETLDFETIELDRAEAGDRALFDPSKEASLARRYEAEARRGFFRSLREFRKIEAEAAERAESVADSASPPEEMVSGTMASCCDEALPVPDDPDAAPLKEAPEAFRPISKGVSGGIEVVRECNGHPLRVGRAVPVPA
jgi:hypothetical protein